MPHSRAASLLCLRRLSGSRIESRGGRHGRGFTLKTLAALALSFVCCVSSASATKWPNGAKAAVVLTYDDALPSQLDHAVPVLDAAGFKATFFLANVKLADVARWHAAAAEGHELGN